MEIHEILSHLPQCPLASYGATDNSADIYTLQFYTREMTLLEPNILYFCSTDELPEQIPSFQLHFLCYGNIPYLSKEQKQSLHVLYYSGDENIHIIFNQIQSYLTHMQKANAGLHMFANAFFSDQGIQYMTDVAYQVFGNPVFVINSSYKYLAISSGIDMDNDFVEKENADGYIAEQGIQFIRDIHLDEKVRNSNMSYYCKNPLFGAGMMVALVRIHGVEVAKVMIYEKNQKLTDIDSLLLSRFARFVSMELQKDSFFNMNKDVMYSYFLADLLDNKEVNYPSVRERLHTMGMDLKDDLYVMTISASSYHSATAKLEVVVRELSTILVGSIYAIYENSLVMLFSRSREQGLSEYEVASLTNYLNANHLQAGMSNFFTDLRTTRRFYLQAKKSAELGTRLHAEGPIFYYSNAYFFHIMEICEKEESLRFFIHPAMMKLLYHDQEKNGELLKTLHAYLEYPGNPGKIAEALHIHKNTLLYRINKIKTLTGCELTEGDEIMSLGFSYKLMRYLKMLPDLQLEEVEQV